ncbi:MAG: hypothetical protein AAGJ73_08225 [Pseudomonadota bacterium]
MTNKKTVAIMAALMLATGGAALAQTSLTAPVERTSLAQDAFSTGVLRAGQGAMDPDLWRGADAETLEFLLEKAPSRPMTPSLGGVLRRTLLSAGAGPEGAPASLGGRKLLALARAGFSEEVRNVASLSSAPANDPQVGQALALADLLDGDTDAACRRNAGLSGGRDAPFWVKLRVLCYAAAGENDAADLTYGLLRDSGALSEGDALFLRALATGAAPKTPPAPENALHLAALRQLQLPLLPSLLDVADAGVLKAIANDGSVDVQSRIAAAARAASMGVVSGREMATLYRSVTVDVADIARAADIAAERPGDPLTDVIVFQSIEQMTAPEFLRDKSARIAKALSIADSFPRAYATSLVYSDAISALDGALIPPSEAGRFALARMTVGDGKSAARWLYAMLGTGSIASMDDGSAMELIELTNLLAVLDPVAAAAVAESAGVSLDAPFVQTVSSDAVHADPDMMARIVEAAFDAAVDDIPGQAALAALAVSNTAPVSDRLSRVVIGQSLRAAGMEELRRRMDFEAVLRTRFDGDDTVMQTPEATKEGALTPRVKPGKT